MSKTVMIVDIQNDFCPGGVLAVPDGDAVIPPINRVIASFRGLDVPLVFTRDWHPRNHCSFKEFGGKWPRHCVSRTWGARFHPNLVVPRGSIIVSKGTNPSREAYSGFQGTELERRLKSLDVKKLLLGGLATDYCVKQTALDGLEAGFGVEVMTDCVKGIDLRRGDSRAALRLMSRRGVLLTSSEKEIKVDAQQ